MTLEEVFVNTQEANEIEDVDDADDDSTNSIDDALREMLGLTSLDAIGGMVEDESSATDEEPRTLNYILELSQSDLRHLIDKAGSIQAYANTSVCTFPSALCVDPAFMRRITDELSWAGDKFYSEKTYETICSISKTNEVIERRKVTRFENFVRTHQDWTRLCDYIGRLTSIICGRRMVLFKEKLNLKPPGGSGFAPHLDGPSLRVALGDDGPRNFVTVMVAIDDMTEQNGCLQFVKGRWSEDSAVKTVLPDIDGNPDGNGRAGAIPSDVADSLPFEPCICNGGSIVLFNDWMPHRSAANRSAFPRRAVFLTYNPLEEGESHDRYYNHMERLRADFRESAGLERRLDQQAEMDALATIPKI